VASRFRYANGKGIHVEKAIVDRLAGWAYVQNMLQRKAIRVWPGAAPNLLRTLPVLQRNSGPGKDPNDLPADKKITLRRSPIRRYEVFEAPPLSAG